MNNEPVIILKNITKNFYIKKNIINVLKGIDFSINKKEFISIVGPSGAGKSTLLYIIGLLSKPDSGEITVSGKQVEKLSNSAQSIIRNTDIGFIFQSYYLLPEFTSIENIIIPALLAGIPKKTAIENARKLLLKVNLKDRENHKPNELSGGEQQRICICRALINNPKIVLADEPTGNLDSYNANLVENLLESLCHEFDTSLIVVTHNENLADRAMKKIKMCDGLIV